MAKDQVLERQTVPKGQLIFKQGERGNTAYLVENGKVGIFRTTDSGERVPLATIGKNEIFGEMAVLGEAGDRLASAIALDETALVKITARTLNEKLRNSDPFLRALMTMLMNNLRNTHERYSKKPDSTTAMLTAVMENGSKIVKRLNAMDYDDPEIAEEILKGFDEALNGLSDLTKMPRPGRPPQDLPVRSKDEDGQDPPAA